MYDYSWPYLHFGTLEAPQNFLKSSFDFNHTKINVRAYHMPNFRFFLLMFSRLCTCSQGARHHQFDNFLDLLIPITLNLCSVLTSKLQLPYGQVPLGCKMGVYLEKAIGHKQETNILLAKDS